MAKRKDKKPKPHAVMTSVFKCAQVSCGALTAEHADGTRPEQCAQCGAKISTIHDFAGQVYAPVPKGYVLAKCNGEAHTNPFIDHCMVCLGGTWGWVFYPQGKEPPVG